MNRILIVSALSSLAFLGACASSGKGGPTFGDEIAASEYGDLAKTWNRADRDVREAQTGIREGEERLERGQRLVRKAREDTRRGEDLIERGEREIRQGQVDEAAAITRRAAIETRYKTVTGVTENPVAGGAPVS